MIPILGMSTKPNYISVEDLVQDSCEEYSILFSAKCWGPSGKTDPGNAPEGLLTKAKINTLVQKQVSAVLSNNNKTTADTSSSKQKTNTNICCNFCKEKNHVKNDCPKLEERKPKKRALIQLLLHHLESQKL